MGIYQNIMTRLLTNDDIGNEERVHSEDFVCLEDARMVKVQFLESRQIDQIQ